MSVQKLVTALVRETTKKYAPFPVNTVLSYLIDEITKQESILSRIEKKLDQHIASPLRVGKMYLEEANQVPDNQVEEKQEYIRKAKDQFMIASQIKLPDNPALPILAQFFVGVCCKILSDEQSAVRWYEKAIYSTDPYIKTYDMTNPTIEELSELVDSVYEYLTFEAKALAKLWLWNGRHGTDINEVASVIWEIIDFYVRSTEFDEESTVVAVIDPTLSEQAREQIVYLIENLNPLITSGIILKNV